jgi:NAD(P)-dependent dehydrogenase (short-subunit alcohol dehydrogenase family)
MNLENNVIVVTGGLGLLGKQIVKDLLSHNSYVIIADVDEIKASDFLKEMNSSKLDFFNCDITNLENIKDLLDFGIKKYNKIDSIVNNAYPRNKNFGRNFLDIEYDDFCENTNLHLGGYFLFTQQFIKYFLKQGYGIVVNIASIQGIGAPKFDTYENTDMTSPVEYSAIKSAIINLTQYMAKYLKNKNIRINSVSPGGIFNNQPEEFLKRYKKHCLNKGMLDPQDVTGSILFLLSDYSKYINGQNIIVDDGWSL